jgi:hypothetical protein
MLELNRADFGPLETFPLTWRFWPSETGVAAEARRARVHPLTPGAAARVLVHASAVIEGVEDSQHAELRDLSERALVEVWLGALPVSPVQVVIVSWDRDTAVQTDWQFFCRYWDDFCYPSSDDVTVTPHGGDWQVSYEHFEVLTFYRRRRAV